jgi:hypothetical protein
MCQIARSRVVSALVLSNKRHIIALVLVRTHLVIASVVGAPQGPRSSLGTTRTQRSLIPAKENARGWVVAASVPGMKRKVMFVRHSATVLARVGAASPWSA